MVRIAYFIMVHHKPLQFQWLLNAIGNPFDLYLVHVDAKSRLGLKPDRRGVMTAVRSACSGLDNVRLMPSRFTNWGGWSLSQALLDAIGMALRLQADWTHFVNLSGQCYPLHPIAQISDELAAAGNHLHVELRPFATLPEDDWHHRWTPIIELPFRAVKLPGQKAPPNNFAITHKGSQWVVLPRPFCEWLVTAPLTQAVRGYLQGLLLSDELLIQTLALNGPWADRIAPSYRRHIVWPGPKLLTEDDLPALRGSTAWFGRKFDVESAPAVVHELARQNGFRPGPEA